MIASVDLGSCQPHGSPTVGFKHLAQLGLTLGILVYRVKLPLGLSACHIGGPGAVPGCSTSNPASCWEPMITADEGPRVSVPATVQETEMESLAPGSGLSQLQLLGHIKPPFAQSFRE